MDNANLLKIYEALEAACEAGEIDPNNEEVVDEFVGQRLEGGITPEQVVNDEELFNVYLEYENLKSKIREEKKKGKYFTFHEQILQGRWELNDIFVIDILCTKNIKDHKKEIGECFECCQHEKCPKRKKLSDFKEKNILSKEDVRILNKIINIKRSCDKYRKEGFSYEKVREKVLIEFEKKYQKAQVTMEENIQRFKVGSRTFDGYYVSKDNTPLGVLKKIKKK